jgi:hypothetical protein
MAAPTASSWPPGLTRITRAPVSAPLLRDPMQAAIRKVGRVERYDLESP